MMMMKLGDSLISQLSKIKQSPSLYVGEGFGVGANPNYSSRFTSATRVVGNFLCRDASDPQALELALRDRLRLRKLSMPRIWLQIVIALGEDQICRSVVRPV